MISAGRTPALASSWRTPVRTPSSGAAGVVSVLSTITRPVAASSSTTSVKVPPMSTARRQSGAVDAISHCARSSSRGREDVEDPHLVQLVVTDEHAVAVPHGARRQVDLARRRAPPVFRRRVHRCGSRACRASMIPSCSLSTWWCRNDRCPAVDAPEAQLQLVAGDHTPAEAGPVGLVERVVVEEVAGAARPRSTSTLTGAAPPSAARRRRGGRRPRRRPPRVPGPDGLGDRLVLAAGTGDEGRRPRPGWPRRTAARRSRLGPNSEARPCCTARSAGVAAGLGDGGVEGLVLARNSSRGRSGRKPSAISRCVPLPAWPARRPARRSPAR